MDPDTQGEATYCRRQSLEPQKPEEAGRTLPGASGGGAALQYPDLGLLDPGTERGQICAALPFQRRCSCPVLPHRVLEAPLIHHRSWAPGASLHFPTHTLHK